MLQEEYKKEKKDAKEQKKRDDKIKKLKEKQLKIKPKKKRAKSTKQKLYLKNISIAKTIAKIRDGYTCQRCGLTTNIHGSHIINEARDHRLATDEDNIKALCYNCHLNRRHKNPLEASDRFKSKRPGRRESLQKKHTENQNKGSIGLQHHEDENTRLREKHQTEQE